MVVESTPAYAASALALSVGHWTTLGTTAADSNSNQTAPTSDLDVLVERVTGLLLIRLVAVVSKPFVYADLSTTTICRSALMRQEPWAEPITPAVIQQLRSYVREILSRYNAVPYHNREHAFHVVLSTHKLMDLMLQQKHTQTHGLRQDPLILFGLVFAALIHDVEHQGTCVSMYLNGMEGIEYILLKIIHMVFFLFLSFSKTGIPNRQLALEGQKIAVLYNDQSIAENRSLYVGFSELLQEEYKDLCRLLFHPNSSSDTDEPLDTTSSELYQRFRKQVIQLVLNTDIASPERTQLAKSKWKEAFGTSGGELKHATSEHSGKELDASEDLSGFSSSSDSTSSSSSDMDQIAEPIIEEAENEDSSSHFDKLTVEEQVQEQDNPAVENKETNGASMEQSDGSNNSHSPKEASQPSPTDTASAEMDHSASKNSPSATDGSNSQFSQTDTEVQGSVDPGSNESVAESDSSLVASPIRERPRFRRPLRNNTTAVRRGARRPNSLYATDNNNNNNNTEQRRESGSGRRESSASSRRESSGSRGSMGPRQRSFRKRLGIRMSMDLSGEAIQTYSRRGSVSNSQDDLEEVDELKASVILEVILTAADVAHNLQGWPQMVKWSNRLYMELQQAFLTQRGTDPQNKWYENQIGFLDFYLLPLALRLEETGVFGETGGNMFAAAVLGNKEQWLEQGSKVTENIVAKGEKMKAALTARQAAISKGDSDTPVPDEGGAPNQGETQVHSVGNGTRACLPQKEPEKSGYNGPSWVAAISLLCIALGFSLVLRDAHMRSTLPIRRGQVVPPGTWMNRCGLFGFLVPECSSSFLNVGSDGVVSLFDADHNIVWEMKGGVCDKEKSDACVDGMKLLDDWRISIGGELVERVDVFLEAELAPWPFAYNPKVKTKKIIHKG